MIVTLTINPAIDRNLSADRLAFEDRAYILSTMEAAGGRGVNASSVIHCFGGKTLAIVTSGGYAGKRLEEYLGRRGYPARFVPIGNEIRTNLTITDKQGLTVSLNEQGPAIEPSELEALEAAVEETLGEASWLMLCGSLPPGVSRNFYPRLIRMAGERGVRTLLDTNEDALQEGVEAGPTVVSPNQHEAERLLNKALITRGHFVEAAERIQGMGAESVILSLGARGAMCAHGGGITEVRPPRVDAVCPIGAGDAMNAAFVWAMEQGKDFVDSVRWGVAAGTASARLPGMGFATLDQTREIYEQVEVRPVR